MKIDQLNDAVLIWGFLDAGTADYLKTRGKTVIIPEQRPFCTGLFQNLPLLRARHLESAYCTDNMLGILFFKQKIAELVLAYAAEDPAGIYAVSGSLYAALLARMHGVKITLHKGENLDYNALFKDRDASTLCGKNFFGETTVVPAVDEFIAWEELGKHEKIE